MNYSALFLQLLPETVLLLTALGLMGAAIASESRNGKALPNKVAMGVSALGILVAAVLQTRVPDALASTTPLLAADGVTMIFKWVILGLGLLAVLLPPAKREIPNPGEYYAMIQFSLIGLMLAVATNHLLMLFVALELASLTLYLLVGFPRTARTTEASLKYFLFGGVSAAFMLFGLSLIYGFCPSPYLPDVAAKLAESGLSPIGAAGIVMVLVGLGFKLAAAPFHFWAPDVYQGGPATSVGLVVAASKVAGMVVLVRFLVLGFGGTEGWTTGLSVVAAVSMVAGNLLALAQQSVRRLLAYSAVANTGYLLVGVCGNGALSSGTALFYVLVYGLGTFGAFAVTAGVERETGSDSVESFAGLVKRSPMLALALLVCLASLAGIPPLAGFAGKFAMFSAALKEGMSGGSMPLAWLVGLAAVMSAISLYYYISVLKQAFVREPVSGSGCKLPVAHVLTVVVPAVALVVLGLFPGLLMDPIADAVAGLLAMK